MPDDYFINPQDREPVSDSCLCDVPVMVPLSSVWNRDTIDGPVRAIHCGHCSRPILACESRHPDHHQFVKHVLVSA